MKRLKDFLDNAEDAAVQKIKQSTGGAIILIVSARRVTRRIDGKPAYEIIMMARRSLADELGK